MMNNRDNALLFLAAVLAAAVGISVFIAARFPLVHGIAQIIMILAGMLMVASMSAISRFVESASSTSLVSVSFDATHVRRSLEGLAAGETSKGLERREPEGRSWEPTLDMLMNQDPALALAKLRIDLERELRRIAYEHLNLTGHRVGTMVRLIGLLEKADVIDAVVVNTLREILPACNLAIHGGSITPDVAMSVLDVGEDLLAIPRTRHLGARRHQTVSE
jgi:hypothetical protein